MNILTTPPIEAPDMTFATADGLAIADARLLAVPSALREMARTLTYTPVDQLAPGEPEEVRRAARLLRRMANLLDNLRDARLDPLFARAADVRGLADARVTLEPPPA